jgi:ferritin-like metal-binding protein YciE
MIQTLEEGFVSELADTLHAERQLVKVLPRMAQGASGSFLREVLERHAEETEDHIARLEQVFEMMGHKPHTEVCEGMQGILIEGRELMQKTGPGPVRDAMIISAAQKVEHYEICAYGTLCAWADEMGEGRVLRLLEQSLFEEHGADRRLTQVAESIANPRADEPGASRSRGYGDRDQFGSRENSGSFRSNESFRDEPRFRDPERSRARRYTE